MNATRLEWIGRHAAGGRVAVLTLDLPDRPVNLLGAAVLDEIERRLNDIDAAGAAGLVIASAKPGVFVAGADLREFVAGLDHPREAILATCRRGQKLFARLSESSYPTVAAINGVCVGGGLELAIWCDRRVAADAPKTQLGFPEVKLGLMPGWGGTARTPRRIGLANAVDLVTGGESVDARTALRLGLVDDLVPPSGDLLECALRLIDSDHARPDAWRRDRQRWDGPIDQSDTELEFLGSTAAAVIQQHTKGRYPAPLAALEAMLGAAGAGVGAACEAEAEAFAPLFGSPVNRALLNVFFLTERGKKTGAADPAAPITTVAVAGGGIMGQGIAAACARRDLRVLLSDNRPAALAAGVAAVVREASYSRATKGIDPELAVQRAAMVSAVEDPARLGEADLVVEAIVEDAAAKRALYATVTPTLRDDALLATNTSTIPVAELAAALARPERFAGLHFFNPVRKMPLVEVIRGPQTSDATVARLAAFARGLGKTPVVVRDGPGFLVNRLLLPYMNEAALLASEGVPFDAIDRAAKEFGMPMGPLELHDVVGLDTCLHAGRVMHAAFADRVVPAPAIGRLVEAGRLGQKSGGGFYDWVPAKGGKPPRREASAAGRRAATQGAERPAPDPRSIVDRLLLPMLLEATRAVADGIVDDPRDVDLALLLGVGFPPDRGGLFFWADTLGKADVLRRLEPFAALGKRFERTPALLAAGRFIP